MFPGGKGVIHENVKKSSSETVNRLKLKKKLTSKFCPEKVQLSGSCCEPDCSMHEIGMQTTGPGLKQQQSNTQHQRHANRKQCERELHVKSADDTYSYTSCSLKKMIASESPKIMLSLILVVGTLSVILVLKFVCYPATISEIPEVESRERRSNDAVNDHVDSKPWETSNSKLISDYSALTGDTKETNLHGGDEEYPDYLSPDLSSILDPIKVNEGYGSNKLRDFYRKLLKTDIQIKNLKKGIANIRRGNIDLSDPNTPRLKRSIKLRFSTRKPTGTTSLNKLNQETENDTWKIIKEIGKNIKGSEEVAHANAIDKVKIIIKEDKAVHEFTNKNPKRLKKKKSKHKFCKWLHDIFGRDTASTQNRRLLQHNYDEYDNDGATEDYEELTKEPWEREKRTVSPLEISVKATSKPYLETSTQLQNDEINYLIDAAMKMRKGKTDNMEHQIKNTKVIINKEISEDSSNYNEFVGMAQAYSDYGVLDNKKEIFENNLAHGNTFKLITSKKPDKTLKWLNNNFDNAHGQRIKLKSSDTSKTEKTAFLKMLRLKMFPKLFNFEIKNNDIEATKMPSNIEVDKTSNSTHVIDTTASWTKSNSKTTQKHKERNVLFSGHRRSLKSVETDESKYEATETGSDIEPNVSNADPLEDKEENSAKYFNNNIAFENKNEHNNLVNETDNITIIPVDQKKNTLNISEGALKCNSSNASWGLGEVFSMLADLCMFLSGFDTNQKDNGYRFLYDFVTMLNPNYSKNANKSSPKNGTNNTMASMESKIGHRSRSLLSFEETTGMTENITTPTSSEKNINESYVVTNKNPNTTIEINNANNTSNIESKKIIEGNRTVVKRSADGDSIFWNDMYDDEYGIKDPMEDDMKDKSVVKINDLIGKDNWINLKIRKIAKSFKDRRNRKMAKKNRNLKNSRSKTTNHTKRAVPVTNEDLTQDSSKQMFKSLTANVKKVCQEAARAVQDTTNRQAWSQLPVRMLPVRADSDQASTLMQQLIGLMSDLVDLQVREKTCVQLPEDLRSFLSWLTSPNTEEPSETGFTVDTYNAGSDGSGLNLHHLHALDDIASSNARSECLGTIHDVEDLIMQYDEMSEEDKSKMSGVREYLEHQLHYLHKQLSNFNEYGSLFMYQDQPIRMRRQPQPFKKKKSKAYKFLSYYNRKHTKHTDPDDTTEDYRTKNKVRNENTVKAHRNDDNRLINNIVEIKDDRDENRVKRNVDSGMKNMNNYLSLVKDNNTYVKYNKV